MRTWEECVPSRLTIQEVVTEFFKANKDDTI